MTQKININLDKLRSIVEVIEEGYWLTFDAKKSFPKINLRIKKLRAPYWNVSKENLSLTSDNNANVQVRDKTLSWPEAVCKG